MEAPLRQYEKGLAGNSPLNLSPVAEGVSLSQLGESIAKQLTDLKNPNFANKYRHSDYEQAVKLAKELATHLYYGKKPKEILKRKRPNEPSNILEYRESSWEDVTYSLLNKATSFIQRVFSRESFRLVIDMVDSGAIPEAETLSKYLFEKYPIYGDFENYLKNHLLGALLGDGNSYQVSITKTPQFNRDKSLNVSPNDLPDPYSLIVPCSKVIRPSEDFLFIESDTKSPLFQQNGKLYRDSEGEFTGLTYLLFTRQATIEFFQYGKINEHKFDYRIWEEHYLGEVPAIKFRGILFNREEKVKPGQSHYLHTSFLQPAVPYLNEYVDSYSDYKLSLKMNLFLQRYEAHRGCPTCGGRGTVKKVGLQGGTEVCPTCNGNKNYHDRSPAQTLVVKATDRGTIEPPAGYIKLPIEVIEEMRKEVERLEYNIFGSINFEFLLRRQIPAGTSGEALVQDKTPANSTLAAINAELQRLANWSLRIENKRRYGAVLGARISEQKAEIQTTERFDVSTYEDLLSNYERLEKFGAPESLVRLEFIEMIEKRYGSENLNVQKTKAKINVDTLWAMKPQEIEDTALNFEGLISGLDILIHFRIEEFINQACINNDGFLSSSREIQRQIIEEIATGSQYEIPSFIQPGGLFTEPATNQSNED